MRQRAEFDKTKPLFAPAFAQTRASPQSGQRPVPICTTFWPLTCLSMGGTWRKLEPRAVHAQADYCSPARLKIILALFSRCCPGLRFDMRVRNFIIANALVAAVSVVALQRPMPRPPNRYSQVVDLTATAMVKTGTEARSETRIISPAALVPGTWGAAQIPAERLIGPLVGGPTRTRAAGGDRCGPPCTNRFLLELRFLPRLARCGAVSHGGPLHSWISCRNPSHPRL